MDGAHAGHESQIRAVDSILEELGYGDIPRLLVFNKADLLEPEQRTELLAGRDALSISATEGTGIDEMLERIDLLLPPAARIGGGAELPVALLRRERHRA